MKKKERKKTRKKTRKKHHDEDDNEETKNDDGEKADKKDTKKHKLTRREKEEKKEKDRQDKALKEQEEEEKREKIRQMHDLQDATTKLTKDVIEEDGLYTAPEIKDQKEQQESAEDQELEKEMMGDGGSLVGDEAEGDGFVKPTYYFNLTKIREEEKRRLLKEEELARLASSSSGPGFETPIWKYNVTKLREEIRAEEQEKLELEGKLASPDGSIAELTEEEMAQGAGKEVEEWLRNKIRHEELKKLLAQQKADLNETELRKKSDIEGEGFTIPEYRYLHFVDSSSTGLGPLSSTGPGSFEPIYKRTEDELWNDWEEMEKEADRIEAERELKIEQEIRDHTFVRAQVDGDSESKYRDAERELEEVEKQRALENRRILRKEWERRKAERERMIKNLTHPDIVFPTVVPKGRLDDDEFDPDSNRAKIIIVDDKGQPIHKQRTRFSHVSLSQTVVGKMNATEKAALDARLKQQSDEMHAYELKLEAATAERERVKAAEKIQFDKMRASGWDGQRFVQIPIP